MLEFPTRNLCSTLLSSISRGSVRATAAVLAIFLAVGTGSADAQPPDRGPRASLLSSTACHADLTVDSELGPAWVVTTTAQNKSSGTVIPEVREGGSDAPLTEIEFTYKDKSQRGNAFTPVESLMGDDLFIYYPDMPTVDQPLPVVVETTLNLRASFPLCNENTPRSEVANARELNATSTVAYGISGGEGETRYVRNRCTDDPYTPENEGGLKVDAITLALITAACETWSSQQVDATQSSAVTQPMTTTMETTTVEPVPSEPSPTATSALVGTTETVETVEPIPTEPAAETTETSVAEPTENEQNTTETTEPTAATSTGS